MIFRNPNAIDHDGSTYDSISALVAAGDVDWAELDRAIVAAWTEWARRYGDALVGADAAQQISDRDATIEAQRKQLSQLTINDWDGLIDALKVAGFSRWLADAGNSQPDLLDEVARLYASAKVGDRIGVITEYMTISAQYEPSIEQLEAWQAVLDNFQPHPIPANLLWFVQPGASTGP
jgi:hypothetical protein